MALQASIFPYTLKFNFPAGTSRGVLKEKKTYLLKVWDEKKPNMVGWGECGPLSKLSIDDDEELETRINKVISSFDKINLPKNQEEIFKLAFDLAGFDLPAIRFAIETAFLDLMNGGQRMIFDNEFFHGDKKIPINGLIWMGHMEAMLLQISDKVAEGHDCLKMKIGSLDFEKEIDILHYIRRKYYTQEIQVRVDANGSFKPEEALYKMEAMARHGIHSIEQPIKEGHHELMAQLCERTPIDIALDEELIAVHTLQDKESLLKKIKPQYIIIKPTLIGGLQSSMEWIRIAEAQNIGWWITSALESNIGLNAICQFALYMGAKSYQGLGTGKLYENNFDSPLTVDKGHIFYKKDQMWNLNIIEDESAD